MPRSISGRFRSGSVGLVAAVCLVACSSEPDSPAASTATAPSGAAEEGTYLALGDSVPFGFRGSALAEFPDPANFVGYPELVGDELGLDVVNASCPGETTGSFLDAAAQSNGCGSSLQAGFGYRNAYPLHVEYEAPDQSQLDFAADLLSADDDVELVTVQIGANDAFLCQRTTASRCSSPADVLALAQRVEANLATILSALRERYDGQLVVVTYYALDYADAFGTATRQLVAGIARVAQEHGADVADAFAAFEGRANAAGGDSTEAGLVLPNDVHPTVEGQRLLADAVLAVVEDQS
ncbi:SGNH/GDSL hydrolase family protein [Blastococcus sp. PRF04-17]|uniref:SGNH/GDSL hydrolase family protein n=1 Tax=Blastococcus sp. PRF04-17 TaxID=2933797 RepID=UPI001FF2AEC6|nr:SGNH/GDSL hydrolase family protein [Blastococcus sp. PRF04-17]UOY01834.1 SGNH/GDSL hydrolase family protein [Blastococcus sp. PRF04-17]